MDKLRSWGNPPRPEFCVGQARATERGIGRAPRFHALPSPTHLPGGAMAVEGEKQEKGGPPFEETRPSQINEATRAPRLFLTSPYGFFSPGRSDGGVPPGFRGSGRALWPGFSDAPGLTAAPGFSPGFRVLAFGFLATSPNCA